ncbi:CPBP family intramembrane glutamic endopeptidase [Radiobacillus sp. PE A8.2]|uniref:CPBP family intramembrane glutamic endopeptidase n=1 Tax=Radiobacillus sp. PE A8.2 TaxID=3380349 RepID=UPI00389051A2
MNSRQAQLVKRMTDLELIKSIMLSQLALLIIGFVAGLLLFSSLGEWFQLFSWSIVDVVMLAFIPAVLIVLTDIMMMRMLPKRMMDDGGINERIFKNRSFLQIITICVLVAFSEELLFRGVLQTHLGYIAASIIFALIHFRYLMKPVLFVSILILSFYLGYIYELTDNLVVPMMAHFFIDFFLALYIRYNK